jgi:hypothetical protein
VRRKPCSWVISPLLDSIPAFSGLNGSRNFEKLRVFTSQEPNSRFIIRAAACHYAHGEIATWNDTVLTIEATHSDSSHRRQVSGNIRESVNYFTA